MKKIPLNIKIALSVSVLLLLMDMAVIFFYAPEEASMGMVQKIFYIHVPSAFNMYIGFTIGFVSSILYIFKRREKFDAIALSANEVGFVFATCVLVTGPLWAKGAWGKFWDFDPRLTSTLIVWLIYFSYLLARKYYADAEKGRLFSAVIAIVGFVDIPIIHYSVRLWRGVHPSVLADKGGLPPSMLKALIFSVCVFVVLFFSIFFLRLFRENELRSKLEVTK